MSESGEAATPPSPTAQALDPGAVLAAWRERGAQRCDPVRFRFIEALARRASVHHGEPRRVLDAKLAEALRTYAERLERAEAKTGAEACGTGTPDRGPPTPAGRGRGLLAALLHDVAAPGAATGELKALSHFRSTWTRLSADQRLRQSRAKLPDNAGPLHSHALVLRSLALMRELSPDYLSRFLSHVDALLWLEQAQGGSVAVPQDVVRGDGDKPRKTARRKSAG